MSTSSTRSNVVLIGMPGAGKSTAGVLLAKNLAKAFVDTDIVLQEHLGTTLQDFLDSEGYLALREQEEVVLLKHRFEDSIIATGGSVVYGDKGMQALKDHGVIVYLSITYETLLKRVHNQGERGIACPPGTSLKDVYLERENLYKKYADIVVELDNLTLEEGVSKLVAALPEFSPTHAGS